MRKICSLCIVLICVFGSVSCHKDREKEPMKIGKTVLVYMATNNNLSDYSESDYAELKSGFIPEWFDEGNGDVLLVYRHASGRKPHLIRFSAMNGMVIEDTVVFYPSQNSCMDTTLKKVMNDAFGAWPSTERGLILSSHGTGWLPEDFYVNPVDYAAGQAVNAPSVSDSHGSGHSLINLPVTEDPYARMVKSFGREDNTEMEIDVLKRSLTYHLDWLAFDCCLMGGVEVAYEVKDCAGYVMFSQTEILADGFPYDGLMEIAFDSGKTVEDRVKSMAELYYRHYDVMSGFNRSATISVVKSAELQALAVSVKNILAAGGRENTDTLSLNDMDELRYVQPYFRANKHWFYDLDDYMSQVCPDRNLYSSFNDAVGRSVIYKASTPSFMEWYGGFPITHFSGLSTYIPRPENGYLRSFYRKSDWGQAICF